MKAKLLLIALFAMAELSLAQNLGIPVDCPEPEFAGDAYIVTGQGEVLLVPHEQLIGRGQASASFHLTGIGSIRGKFKLEGKSSPLKVLTHDFWLIIRVENNNRSPFSCVRVFRMNQEGDSRVAEFSKSGTFSGASSNTLKYISFDAHKYKTSSYAIRLSIPWVYAEYGVKVDWSAERTDTSNDVLTLSVLTYYGPDTHLDYILKHHIDLRLYDDFGRARYYDCATGKYINEVRFARKYGKDFIKKVTEEYYKKKKIPMKEAQP